MTARTYDTNGWFTVKDNPISRVGVFPYRGASIGAEDPDAIYQVYRPADELSDPEALASFALIPWIDDHEMLGEDLTDALDKGVAGVTGENVWFDPDTEDGVLRSNLKCFSEVHAQEIEAGKRELSAGYRCVYDFTPGVFKGKAYDAIQRTLRGNHLASVDEGRMGPLVAVLDHSHTEEMEQATVTTRNQGRAKPRQLTADDIARINASPVLAASMIAALDASEDETEVEVKAEDEEVEAKAEDEEEVEAKAEDEEEVEAKAEDEEEVEIKAEDEEVEAKAEDAKHGMDEAVFVKRMASRNSLARDLKPVIGAFDHAEMTLDGVAAYGVKKLKLRNVPKGQEELAVRMFVAGRSSVASAKAPGAAMDSAEPKVTGYAARRFNVA